MAYRLLRPLRRSLLPRLSSYSQTLIPRQKPCIAHQTRNYISEMRESAVEGNILRLLRSEIQYELERDPPSELSSDFNSFKIDSRPGEQYMKLTRKFGENEEIEVEVTMFDGSAPVEKTGNVAAGEDVKLHITLIVDVSKGEGGNTLVFVCSAWPDSMEINKVFLRSSNELTDTPYLGPDFKDLDDDLQNGLYDFLEARGIDDDLAAFLHGCVAIKDKTEVIRWMDTVKSFIEKK